MNATTNPKTLAGEQNASVEVKVYCVGRGKASGYRCLVDYTAAGTERQAAAEARRFVRRRYGGMKPQIVEIGGCRRIPGAGKIMWVAAGVADPRANFIQEAR